MSRLAFVLVAGLAVVLSASASPSLRSGPGPLPLSVQAGRDSLVAAGKTLYDDRANEHYTEGSQRWSGIDGKVYPPNAPPYSDCSSAVTWIYWTVYGGGPDFLNGENWKAGYTGTMQEHGKVIPYSQIQPGDLVFYANPEHVTMYMGNGQVVSHGEDPVAIEAWDYRPVQEIRTYL